MTVSERHTPDEIFRLFRRSPSFLGVCVLYVVNVSYKKVKRSYEKTLRCGSATRTQSAVSSLDISSIVIRLYDTRLYVRTTCNATHRDTASSSYKYVIRTHNVHTSFAIFLKIRITWRCIYVDADCRLTCIRIQESILYMGTRVSLFIHVKFCYTYYVSSN